MGKRTVNRRAVLEQMMALAAGAANDVVKLAYLTQEQTQEIDTLDLGCLTEFKRNSSGAVEVKLTDRAAVLEKLLEQLKDEDALRQLYNAMKVKDFDQLVEQVMYVSNMLGRMQDG